MVAKGNGIKAVLDRPVRSHDRGRDEERTMVFDAKADHKSQQWYLPETGKRTGGKRGRLSDPSMSGAASHDRFEETGI